jgi:endoglycosylceramidase
MAPALYCSEPFILISGRRSLKFQEMTLTDRIVSGVSGALLATCTAAAAAESAAPAPSRPPAATPSGFVTVAGARFLDRTGKPLILHGINVVPKSKAQGYVGDLAATDFGSIRSWGMNCVRLGIFWDGLEPEPGRIDEAYLEKIARLVSWAREAGLFVLLDMHQDLYSVKFSDGAPAWATLDEGKPHTKGAVWSDAYYVSEAVQTALDHFWANSPAPDGAGLQDHYARVWRRVAERFKDEPAVIGFDLMNEPFPGRDAAMLLQAMMARLAKQLAGRPEGPTLTVEQLAGMQATPEGRKQITQWLADLEFYKGMLEAAAPIMQNFDRAQLQPFYARMRHAIRQVNSHQIIFFEPAMSANLGIPTALVPLTGEQGQRDPQQAYAPHGYDIVVDTSSVELMSRERVALIFRRHGEFANQHKLPILVGEWGAYYLDPRAVDPARFVVQQFDALGCGDTYWDYERALTKSPLLGALRRQYRPDR